MIEQNSTDTMSGVGLLYILLIHLFIYLSICRGCGPVVRLLACHAGAQYSIPYRRESGIFYLKN